MFCEVSVRICVGTKFEKHLIWTNRKCMNSAGWGSFMYCELFKYYAKFETLKHQQLPF